MAEIYNDKSNTLLTGTSGDDYIKNGGYWYENGVNTYHYGGSNITINTGVGNDSVYNENGDSVTINTGDGNDSVHNWNGKSVTINTGEGNDSVENNGSSVTINTGAGNDYVWNPSSGKSVTINTGEGNDSVENNGSSVTINTGAGDDSIKNYFDSLTISGGKGNDSIYNNCYRKDDGSIYYFTDGHGSNVVFNYNSGDGNDIIYGFKDNSTLSISSDSYSTAESGDDIIFTVGDGSITLKGAATLKKVNIDGVYRKPSLFTDGNDTYNNTVNNVTLDALGGKDTITNSGENVSINGGAGNDLVTNNAAQNVTINTAEGNDTVKLGSAVKSFKVENFGSGDVISLATAVDSLETVSGGIKAGSVTISGITNVAKTTSSWQTYSNFISRVSSTSAGAKVFSKKITYDTTSNSSTLFTITGLKSTVGVSLSGKTVTLTEAALANRTSDTITTSDGYTLALAKGVDTIKEALAGGWTTLSSGNVAYLKGGTGSYYSLSGGNKIIYNASVAGNDNMVELCGVKGTPTLSGTNVSLAADNFASDVSVVSNAGNYIFYLKSDLKGKKFTGGEGDDTVQNYGSKSVINGGAGNDEIYNGLGSLTAIDGGAGDDYVVNYGSSVTIDGDAGNDTICNNGYIKSDGSFYHYDDSLGYAENVLFKYEEGDGDDVIYGFKANSTLQIGDGKGEYSSVKSDSGSDIIVTVGDGNITLQGAASLETVNILGKLLPDTQSGGDDTQSGGGDDTEGKIFTNTTKKVSLSGTAYEDEFYNRASTVTIKGGNGGDYIQTIRKTSSVKMYGEAGDDTLESYSGTKNLLNGGADNDEIYISGGASITAVGGAGNDTIEIENSNKVLVSVSAAGDGSDIVYGFNETTTLKIGDGKKDTYYSEKVGEDVIVTVGAGIVTLSGAANFWVETLNDGKGGLSNIQGVFTGNSVAFDDNSKSPATLDAKIEKADASKRSKAIKITGNALDNSIVGGSGKDTLYGGEGADTIDGGAGDDKLYGQAGDDSLFGGAGNDTLTGGEDSDVFIYSGGKDVIKDYVSGEDAISLGAAYSKASIKGNDVILTVGKGTLTIKEAKYQAVTFLDGEDYETKRIGVFEVDNSTKTPLTISEDVEFVDATARTKDFKVTGNELNNTILGGSGKDAIYGGNGTDSLLGGAGNDKLYGGEGEDTLWGGAGNDTLTGDEDDDLFVYSGGKDVITDYVSGEDMISLGAAYTSTAVSGSDVILTIKKNNTLTIKDARGKEITFVDADGNESTEKFGVTVVKDAEYVAKDGEVYLDASSRTKTTKITGNELNNTILGGSNKDTLYGEYGDDSIFGGAGADNIYGGEGDDILIGGKGNDTLWGDSDSENLGSDTFIYNKGDGKDVIMYFDEDDKLEINGVSIDDISAKETTTAIVLTIDSSNTITFKKYATDTLNINGDIYEVKGTRLVKTDR